MLLLMRDVTILVSPLHRRVSSPPGACRYLLPERPTSHVWWGEEGLWQYRSKAHAVMLPCRSLLVTRSHDVSVDDSNMRL